jgi:hypothetical protein
MFGYVHVSIIQHGGREPTGRLCFLRCPGGKPSSAKLVDAAMGGAGEGILDGSTYGGMYRLMPDTLPEVERPPDGRDFPDNEDDEPYGSYPAPP